MYPSLPSSITPSFSFIPLSTSLHPVSISHFLSSSLSNLSPSPSSCIFHSTLPFHNTSLFQLFPSPPHLFLSIFPFIPPPSSSLPLYHSFIFHLSSPSSTNILLPLATFPLSYSRQNVIIMLLSPFTSSAFLGFMFV